VLALRADRMATVRRVLAGLTDAGLAGWTEPVTEPGYPAPESFAVRRCLQAILTEEWEHRLYAERDLSALESRFPRRPLHPVRPSYPSRPANPVPRPPRAVPSTERNHDDVTSSWSWPQRCDIVVVPQGRSAAPEPTGNSAVRRGVL